MVSRIFFPRVVNNISWCLMIMYSCQSVVKFSDFIWYFCNNNNINNNVCIITPRKIDKLYFKINKIVFKNGKRFRSNRSSSGLD